MAPSHHAHMEWRPGVVEKLGYYVYLFIDPRSGQVFYVGKGVGSRCFAHIREARKTARDSKGHYEKLSTIRDIEESGQGHVRQPEHRDQEAELLHHRTARRSVRTGGVAHVCHPFSTRHCTVMSRPTR